jgi:hypothetical protein
MDYSERESENQAPRKGDAEMVKIIKKRIEEEANAVTIN